jgi:hypothetical protein
MTNTTTQTETKQTYNGWTNYATWRVALEWFDDFNPNKYENDPYDLSKELQSYVEDTLSDTSVQSQIVLDYALAFTSDVNWYEIAQHLIEEQEG